MVLRPLIPYVRTAMPFSALTLKPASASAAAANTLSFWGSGAFSPIISTELGESRAVSCSADITSSHGNIPSVK